MATTNEALVTEHGRVTFDHLGSSVAAAGDWDGDGFADVLVSAPDAQTLRAHGGEVHLYRGGIRPRADAARIFLGEGDDLRFGVAVGTAGDVDGDGFDDILVASEDAGGSTGPGRVVLVFGTREGTPRRLRIVGSSGERFGACVSSAGDFNGDRFADFAIGAPDANGTGRVYLFYGGPALDAVPDLVLAGEAPGDRFGIAVACPGDLDHDGFVDLIVGAEGNDAKGVDAGRAYVFFGGSTPDASVDRTFTGAAAGDRFGCAAAAAGDVNGDGTADVIVGAVGADAFATPDVGRAYLYFGSRSLDTEWDVRFTGKQTNDRFGQSVATAGDVDADGFDDLLIGAPGYDDEWMRDAGRAYVFLGSPGMDNSADHKFTGSFGDARGSSVACAGDVNGDGYLDLAIGAPDADPLARPDAGTATVVAFYPYAILAPTDGERWIEGGVATLRWLGREPADVELSRDGGATWTTLATGVGGGWDNTHRVLVPTGVSDRPIVRLTYAGQVASRATSMASRAAFRIQAPWLAPGAAPRAAVRFPSSSGIYSRVSGAGDLNGDGFADFVATGSWLDASGRDVGRAWIHHGGPAADTLADWVITARDPNQHFTRGTSAGDVNGDGYGDLAIGAMRGGTESWTGVVYVYYSGPIADDMPDRTLYGESQDHNFGVPAGNAGDLNGDGRDDLFIAAPQHVDRVGRLFGRVYLYFGGNLTSTPDRILTQPGWFGWSVSPAGDLNGDGYGDLAVGSLRMGAWVYFGGPNFDETADLHLPGSAADVDFGQSVTGIGDWNGDGYDDLAVAAHLTHPAGSLGGAAFVCFGGPGMDALPDWWVQGPASERVSATVKDVGDVNRDGSPDLAMAAQGNVLVFFGGPGSDGYPDMTLDQTAECQWPGFLVDRVGDQNGDGFDDLFVGARAEDRSFARLYYLDRYRMIRPVSQDTWIAGAQATVSWIGRTPADVWLSIDAGVHYERIASAAGGMDTNVVTVRASASATSAARLRLVPSDASIAGSVESELFAIRTGVALLSLEARFIDRGAEVSWASDPTAGPEGIAGYRLYRAPAGAPERETRLGPEEPILASSWLDPDGRAGMIYRLTAIDAVGVETTLGRVTLANPAPAIVGLRAWPSPIRSGRALELAFSPPLDDRGRAPGDLLVEVFDVRGRLLSRIGAGGIQDEGGVIRLRWDCRVASGGRLAAGIYFARATARSGRYEVRQRFVMID